MGIDGVKEGKSLLCKLDQGYEILDDGTDLSIERDRKSFEIVCSWHAHPYCDQAEVLFKRNFPNNLLRYLDVNIKMYLRDKETLEPREYNFSGDIGGKQDGVQSGIVIFPFELRGLLCAPTDKSKRSWVVFRPFETKHHLEPEQEKAMLAKSLRRGLPVASYPREAIVTESRLAEIHNIDPSKLADKGIISHKERRIFFTRVGTFLKYHDTVRGEIRYMVDKAEIPRENINRDFYILGASGITWPKIPHNVMDFNRMYMASLGWNEFVKGKIVREGDNIFFVPNVPLTDPSLSGMELFIPSAVELEDVRESMRERISATV